VRKKVIHEEGNLRGTRLYVTTKVVCDEEEGDLRRRRLSMMKKVACDEEGCPYTAS
jgi:hypothetical protein